MSRCAAYVRGMGIKADALEPKHIAWLVGDAALSVEELDSIGAGDTPSGEWGNLLPLMDRLMADRMDHGVRDELEPWFGSRGIKTKAIKGADEFNMLARIMWPHVFSGENISLRDMLFRIKRMSKSSRRKAQANMQHVPARFFAPDARDLGE